jgi:hypothetical protein
MGICANAENEGMNALNEVARYELKISNYNSLYSTLELTNDQKDSVKEIIDEYERDIEFSILGNDGSTRETLLKNSINKHIKYMSYILTKEQYKKYLMLFNLTLRNRGIEIK